MDGRDTEHRVLQEKQECENAFTFDTQRTRFMFTNFIYVLIALILYSTCTFSGVADTLPASPFKAVLIAVALIFVFAAICRSIFDRLARRTNGIEANAGMLDHQLDKALSRLSALAIALFAFDLYVLHLHRIAAQLPLFSIFPTLQALIFLTLFMGYLVIVWKYAWKIQREFFAPTVTQKEYIISNISFALPALLPWLLLSFTADLIELIPFDQPKGFLSTPMGEIFYVLTFLILVACFGPLMIKKIWRCKSLEDGPERRRIEGVCKRANLDYADILRWELFGGSMITAGVMGLWGRYRYILVTPALLHALEPEEIDAVIIHEIGHIQKKHIHFYLFFFAGYIACTYALFDPMILIYYSDPLIKLIAYSGMDQEVGVTVMLSALLIALFLIYFRYVFGFYMRNFERQADIHVYNYLPSASPMIRTFYKIAGFNRSAWDKPNWHHFSIKERVQFLNRCDGDPSLIEKHNTKVNRMIHGYIAVLILICLAGYHFNFGSGKDQLNRIVAEKILTEQLAAAPNNVDLHLLAGDYYYDKSEYAQAVLHYGQAISIDPMNSHALNNLAWLHATCPETQYQDHARALSLATRALQSNPAPHVLDTYAEACYLNGLFEEAAKASTEALKRATDRLDYYRKQQKRFAIKKDAKLI